MGLRVGGVVVPYWPSYWGGMGYYGNSTNVTNQGGAGNDTNSGADAGVGDGSAGAIST
jgi:hypothetical protein